MIYLTFPLLVVVQGGAPFLTEFLKDAIKKFYA